MNTYEVVYLGYPNWWGTMPMAVFTFLESYDFTNKTIVPFCTHEGSGMGRSEKDIAKLCPRGRVLAGLAIVGGKASAADATLTSWLKKSSLI
jgi:flavodoxin